MCSKVLLTIMTLSVYYILGQLTVLSSIRATDLGDPLVGADLIAEELH